MAKAIKARNADGELVTFRVGEFVEFKYDIEQSSVIHDVRSGQVLVTISDGGYAEHGSKTWMPCSKCWND